MEAATKRKAGRPAIMWTCPKCNEGPMTGRQKIVHLGRPAACREAAAKAKVEREAAMHFELYGIAREDGC